MKDRTKRGLRKSKLGETRPGKTGLMNRTRNSRIKEV